MRRIGWAGAALATIVFILDIQSLAATLYGRGAEAHLDQPPDQRTIAAAALASHLAPWNASASALDGWVLTSAERPEEAENAYVRALRWAPGDPLLWNEYALALARLDVFDERLVVATRRSLQLAPSSPAVRGSIAAMGIAYWIRGDLQLRDAWRESMRWELDHVRDLFLHDIEIRGDKAAFCHYHAPYLGEQAWCGKQP